MCNYLLGCFFIHLPSQTVGRIYKHRKLVCPFLLLPDHKQIGATQ